MARSVGIIIGSTRPNCNGKVIATWISTLIQQEEAAKSKYTLIDLADWNLPLFNEPGIPMKVAASLDHSKAWSQQIKSLDAFLFITPQVQYCSSRFLPRRKTYMLQAFSHRTLLE